VLDGEGAPSYEQWKTMVQKLLADRFKLTFHRDKKELSLYVLTCLRWKRAEKRHQKREHCCRLLDTHQADAWRSHDVCAERDKPRV
jgi:uncharacterized protein (TIGR03435 family)